jgi:hypothetical protein
MRFSTFSCICIVISLFWSATAFNSKIIPDKILTSKYRTEYVWIAVIDGPRFSETFGDTSFKNIPHLGKELQQQGTLFLNFRNEGSTFTNAGHTAITTGVYQGISNSGKELPKNPGIFQFYLKQKNVDKSDAYLIAGKGKLEILANTKDKDWWNTYMPSSYCGPNGNASEYAGDQIAFNKLLEIMQLQPPHLLMINFLAADTQAHGKDWEGYLGGIKSGDKYVFDLWNEIQRNPLMKDKTTLIVTNDHGRHLDGQKDGFVSHGDRCEGCRKIFMLALGPDTPKGKIVEKEAELIDIPITVAEFLGFKMLQGDGKLLSELFLGNEYTETR